MDNQINLQLVLDATGHVTSYSTVGGLEGAVNYDGVIPSDFLETTQTQAFKLIDNVLTKDPNYVEPTPDAVKYQPSDEQQFQAELALQIATMQKNQAEFNAKVLLQLADLKNVKAQVTPATSETTATSEAPVTSEVSAGAVTSETPVETK